MSDCLPDLSATGHDSQHDSDLRDESQEEEDYATADSGTTQDEDVSHAPADLESIRAAVVKQVEFYFSDANLPTDKHLMKQIRKDPEGFVPIKVIANFKRVKGLTKNLKLVTEALRMSEELLVSEDGKRVRRQVAVPEYDIQDIQRRTVIAEHLPGTPSIESVTQLFAKYGHIRMVRICLPGASNKLPIWLTNSSNVNWSSQQFALIEYDTEDQAIRAVHDSSNADNWRTSLRTRHLLRNFKPAHPSRPSSRPDQVGSDAEPDKGQATPPRTRPGSRTNSRPGSRRSSIDGDRPQHGQRSHDGRITPGRPSSQDGRSTPPSARTTPVQSTDGVGAGAGPGDTPAAVSAYRPPHDHSRSASAGNSPGPGVGDRDQHGRPGRRSGSGTSNLAPRHGTDSAHAMSPAAPGSPSGMHTPPRTVSGSSTQMVADVASFIDKILLMPTNPSRSRTGSPRVSSGGQAPPLAAAARDAQPLLATSSPVAAPADSMEEASAFASSAASTPAAGVAGPANAAPNALPVVATIPLASELLTSPSFSTFLPSPTTSPRSPAPTPAPAAPSAGLPPMSPSLRPVKTPDSLARSLDGLSVASEGTTPVSSPLRLRVPRPDGQAQSKPLLGLDLDHDDSHGSVHKPPKPRSLGPAVGATQGSGAGAGTSTPGSASSQGQGQLGSRRPSWQATPEELEAAAAVAAAMGLRPDGRPPMGQGARGSSPSTPTHESSDGALVPDTGKKAAGHGGKKGGGKGARQRRNSYTEGHTKAAANGDEQQAERQRRRSSGTRRAEEPAGRAEEEPGDEDGKRKAKEKKEKEKEKEKKKDYANWAAATAEFRAESSALKYGRGSGGSATRPNRSSGGGAPHVEGPRVARGPDNTKGFSFGRGMPIAPPKTPPGH